MDHRKTTITLATTAIAVALAALFVGPSARAATMQITTCGQLVKTNAVVTQDLDCAGTGILVGASGITIDLQGHVLKGSGGGTYGVFDISGYDDVMIKNGVVRNFGTGVWAVNGADELTVSNVVAAGNAVNGVVIDGSSASIASSTVSGNGGTGVFLSGASPSVKSSTASGNSGNGIEIHVGPASITSSTAVGNTADGMDVQGDAVIKGSTASGNVLDGFNLDNGTASITSSTASGNGAVGIYFGNNATVVKGNRAESNGFSGGSSDHSGLGIYVKGSTPANAGTNIARGNDDPLECIPSSLCPVVGSKVKAGSLPISSCAQTVTTDAYLTKDLDCPGASGIVVGADGFTIDLNGHVLEGDRLAGHYGVEDKAGYGDITIENGVVRNFADGVLAGSGANDVVVSNVVSSGNVATGIAVSGGHASIKSSAASGNAAGITVTGNSASITSSQASGNSSSGIYVIGDALSAKSNRVFGNGGNGFLLAGDSGSITSTNASGNASAGVSVIGGSLDVKSSTASGNGTLGIGVWGDAAALQGNRTDANGFQGGASDGLGPGILVDKFTTAPTGTNPSRGNDDPGECSPASLC